MSSVSLPAMARSAEMASSARRKVVNARDVFAFGRLHTDCDRRSVFYSWATCCTTARSL